MIQKDYDLFFTCSLIEVIGRRQKLKRSDVVSAIGEKTLRRIYRNADILHCEPIEKVADDYIELCQIPTGDFDNTAQCRYAVPDYWTIGEVYDRLIEDVRGEDTVGTLMDIYHSWISDSISNYNSDFFYQPRDYLRECWIEQAIL